MLKKNFRNYIEEAVRDQYQKIDKNWINGALLQKAKMYK